MQRRRGLCDKLLFVRAWRAPNIVVYTIGSDFIGRIESNRTHVFNFSCIDAQSTHLATPEFIITPLGMQDQVLEFVVVDVVVVVVVVV